jgi:hypothetical protein
VGYPEWKPVEQKRGNNMPLAVTCKRDKDTITIDETLRLRDESDRKYGASSRRRRKLGFLCIECGEPVHAHAQKVTGEAAHFEHYRGQTKSCTLTDDS